MKGEAVDSFVIPLLKKLFAEGFAGLSAIRIKLV
jgi:hypothetical protein